MRRILPWQCLAVAILNTSVAVATTVQLTPEKPLELTFGEFSAGELYGVTVALPRPSALAETDHVDVRIEDAEGTLFSKTLHAGDPDLYVTARPRQDGPARLVAASTNAIELAVDMNVLTVEGKTDVIIAAGPSDTWQTAQPIELGKTVFASNDERAYIPPVGDAAETLANMFSGAQWYTFTYAGQREQTVHFVVDIIDRDVPMDVALFVRDDTGEQTRIMPYEQGVERFIPEQSTTFHGLYKFITRTISPGTYYVRVMGNHPSYQLRTEVYDPPPYTGPGVSREAAASKAIRIAMDYLINKGDSWHANTPRRGSVVLRTSTALQETQTCIACHPTHFTTRAEIVGVQNGWPVRQRHAMKFLTERLYNNPRPLYGYPDAAWARMISAPGNVLGRLAYIEMEFENRVSKAPRAGIMPDIANFLEMYWQGVDEPIDESAGTLPLESGIEIAMHNRFMFDELHRRTGQLKYAKLRDQIENIIVQSEPRDVLALAWKMTALGRFDREKYADLIHEMVERMFSYQRDDGTWPMVFSDKIVGFDYYRQRHTEKDAPLDEHGKPVASEFQTHHSVYALACCGVTTDDPRLAKAVDWCLSRQWPSGAWQGNPDYKNFDTTFRETQYAIMAMAQLYAGPGSEGWMAGFDPPPTEFSATNVDSFLAAVDQYWADASPAVLDRIRAGLDSPHPLIRQASATTLGRLADVQSVQRLGERLGDASKLVQRAAAVALREIATRHLIGHEIIRDALRSDHDRTRWGAAMVFNQHFRFLAQDAELLDAMLERLDLDKEPAPTIRMLAAQSLAKWWFWLKDTDGKARIEDAFLAAMSRPEHPYPRRALIEGFRNINDDNTRYLYNTWSIAAKQEQEQQQIEQAHRDNVQAQAKRIARALQDGNEYLRDAVLRSFYTFHLHEAGQRGNLDAVKDVVVPATYVYQGESRRGENKWIDGYKEAAAYDPSSLGTGAVARLGNDSDPPQYYEQSAPLMADALVEVLKQGEGELDIGVIKTLRHIRGVAMNEPLSAALIAVTARMTPETAGERKQLLLEFLPDRILGGEAVAAPLSELITYQSGPALDVAAAILNLSRNENLARNELVAAAVMQRTLAADVNDANLPNLLTCLTWIPAAQDNEPLVEKVFSIIESGPSASQTSAARLMLRSPRFLAAVEPRKRFERLIRQSDAPVMQTLLKAAGELDAKAKESEHTMTLALGLVARSLEHDADAVRVAAIDTIRTLTPIQNNAGVVTALQSLAKTEDSPSGMSAKTLLASFDARNELAHRDVTEILDFDYFVHRVQPIFQAKSEDKNACVQCHANHSIFRLHEPDIDGRITDAELRDNYLNAIKVIDLAEPEQSLLLLKPTSSFDGIGVIGNYRKTHGGDVRWADGKNSEDYRTILKWIQGARLTNAADAVDEKQSPAEPDSPEKSGDDAPRKEASAR